MAREDAPTQIAAKRREPPPAASDGAPASDPSTARTGAFAPRVRQKEEFGGFHWGAAFFGWLVATGISTILIAIIAAAGAAVGLTSVSETEATRHAATIGVVGAIALIVILLIAYYAGGYVAGRMSRFDGARQGFAVWAWGIVITLIFAAAGVILGNEYNVLNELHLPRIPIKEGSLATGGAITLAAVVVGTLLVAVLGGSVGRRYHSKVDEIGRVPRRG